jgi:hypothetical protein
MWLAAGVGLCLAALVRADTVTLNSGEVLEGRIISETDEQIEMEVLMFRGTILSNKQVPKADIKSIVREDIAVKQEKAAYAELTKFTLNPNQELGTNQYAAGIAAFQGFLAKYPKSESATNVSVWVADWRAEASNVSSGKVKFASKWMTPDEKKVLAEQAQLAALQSQRNTTFDQLSAIELKLSAAQAKLAAIEKSESSGGTTAVGADRGGMAGQLTQRIKVPNQTLPEEHPRPNPEKAQLQSEISGYQQQISQGQTAIGTIDAKIKDLQAQLPKLEQEAKPANSPGTANAVPEKKPSRHVEPAPEPPGPWYSRAWKWISSFWH